MRTLLFTALFAPSIVPLRAAEANNSPILEATRAFVKKESPALRNPTIKLDKVQGEYARAVVSAKSADTAFAFLQRKGGIWTVLSLGTGFGPDFYRRSGIPKELQLSFSGTAAKIKLARSPGSNPIGVEPQGGHFAQIIGPLAKTPGEYTFSTYGQKQDDSVLAIYATDSSLIPLEKPLARVRLTGLQAGETERRIRVRMNVTSGRELSISATDLKYRRELAVTQVFERDLREARLQLPATPGAKPATPLVPGLLPVALGSKASSSSVGKFIGVRRAGGMFKPVLTPNDTPETTAKEPGTTYFCTSFPGQLTVDLRLFAGNSPYIENTKPYVRYLVSGIKPNGRAKNSIKLELRVKPGGGVEPTATEIATGTKLTVEKYSRSAIERLQSQGVLGQTQPLTEANFAGRIPATPGS